MDIIDRIFELVDKQFKEQKDFAAALRKGITAAEEEIFERVNEKILDNIMLFDSEDQKCL